MAPIHGNHHPPQQHQQQHRLHKLNPDPIRTTSPHSKLSGCGPHRSYRHLHHQRGTIGTFHVRLLEGRGLSRKHWSALSLGPVKHLGLSRAHGEVSSFGTLRLAFWRDGSDEDDGLEESEVHGGDGAGKSTSYASSLSSTVASSSESSSVASSSITPSNAAKSAPQHSAFMPSMPMAPNNQTLNNNNFDRTTTTGKSPLTPLLFDQGCIRTLSPARSPFVPSHAQQKQPRNNQNQLLPPNSGGLSKDWDVKPSSMPQKKDSISSMPMLPHSSSSSSSVNPNSNFGPPHPHHYAKEQFKSSTIENDSNPIWGDAHSFLDSTTHHSSDNGNNDNQRSAFHIPLQKDDFLPTLHTDGGTVGLEIRLDEEMAPTESLLVGGALSTAVGAATAATSVVGMGRQAQNVSNMGMQMLGLGTDRLIGRGYVDLMPLILGLWEESWEQRGQQQQQQQQEDIKSNGNNVGKQCQPEDSDAVLNEYGRIDSTARMMRRRIERMGMLDVWVPLYHPTEITKSNNNNETVETSGKIHLLISYEPNGMVPKRDDVVAFESFARRPLSNNNQHDGSSSSSANIGPVITPIVPPLSPLLVIDSKGSYLLLEYITSRTVTSVDRSGNVKSSRWERPHRVRIHRHAVFVIERKTLMDAAGNIARMPGDIVLSTPIGQEIAEVSAPIVAGAMELVGPAMLWGKLMMAAGGTGVRASLAGARVAADAVVTASQEMALERREGGGGGGDGVYSYGG